MTEDARRGLLIGIAGIDGAGKSTLAHYLRRAVERIHGPCVVSESKDDFAIQTATAAAIAVAGCAPRDYFGNFAFDFAKAFDIVRDHFVRTEPLLRLGTSVILPRTVDCRLALARSKGSEPIEKIEAVLRVIPRPDITFRARLDPEVACERVHMRGVDEERLSDLVALDSALDALPARDSWIEFDASPPIAIVAAHLEGRLCNILTPASRIVRCRKQHSEPNE